MSAVAAVVAAAEAAGASANPRALVAFALGFAAGQQHAAETRFSTPDQPRRFAEQKARADPRLKIDDLFQPALLKGKRVLVTGTTRGQREGSVSHSAGAGG